MTKQNIVLFCENHQDSLSATAQSITLDRLNKKKWTHSLVEDNEISTNHFFRTNHETHNLDQVEQDVLLDYFYQSYRSNTCNYEPQLRGPIKTKFLEKFSPTYFDVDNRNNLNNHTIFNCEKLQKLATTESDSRFCKSFKEIHSVDFFDFQRNIDVVSNLKSMITNLGSNYTIGWAGIYHCVELHHKLVAEQSPLLEKMLFVHLASQPCSINIGEEEELSLVGYYDYCNATSQMLNDINRFEECEDDNNQEEEIDFSLQTEHYLKSNNTMVLNLSLSGEPGTILPWQLADLDIFN